MPRILKPEVSTSSIVVKNKASDTAEILVYGIIGGDGFWEEGITLKQFSDVLKGLDSKVKNITLRINSVGGEVFTGWAIYNLLKQSGKKITTYVDGVAASIASVIALAGDKVIMGEGAQIMIHSAWTIAAGNSRDFLDIVNRLEDIDNLLINLYAKKTKKTKDEIRALVQAETWFTAETAVDIGLADEKAEDTYAIAAQYVDKAKWFKKSPSNIVTNSDLAKAKIKEILNKK
ncbi:Clp protease ClpP [Candidatus Dependentiae bacterium]|nr:MAG: Clp protease ClpP [Candidatus Dependentiae bacterium]